jgi:hypothetical protein
MAEIFFSYKTEDRKRVAPLVAALREAGLDTWWDQDIPPGGGWRDTIADQLDEATLCVVTWTRESTGARGRFVREEAERAAGRGAYLGVLIDPVQLPFGFAEWQAIDLSDWNGKASDPLLGHFVAQVRARLGQRPAEPPPPPPPPRARRALAKPLAIGAGILLLLATAFLLIPRLGPAPAAPPMTPTAFVNSRLGGTACSWLQISNVSPAENGERIALAGIASSPASVQGSLMREAMQASVPIAEIGMDDVATGPAEICAQLELLRQYRWAGRSRLSVIPSRGALQRTEHGWSGRFEFELDYRDLPPHAALLGLDSIGGVEVLIPDLQAFHRANRPLRTNGTVAAYEGYFFDENRNARNVGLILMTAAAPIDAPLVGEIGARADRAFLARVADAARAGRWQFELALVRCGFEAASGRRQC